MNNFSRLLTAGMLALLPVVAFAQQGDVGPVTNLPLPRYVSMKAVRAYVRRGPAQTHRIDWVLNHRGTPLQVTAEYGNWLRVIDADSAGGWVHRSLLSGVRTVVVTDDKALLFETPDEDALPIAEAEKGVIARLGPCQIEWCEVTVDGFTGWVLKIAIWGIDAAEIRE
ncbi:MAG: aspartyl-trna synthetase [Rhodobacteraceae bacterium]|nr:aspartyl-trna synthetase [Paracoccaceae bacterium]